MNITFLIGNGFDLRLGMKTKYLDMYDEYVNKISNNQTINRFKADLHYDSTHKYENWSDFEMGMARYSLRLDNEKELIDCVRDFKVFMVSHLKKEETNFWKKVESPKVISKYIENFYDSLNYFYSGLDENTIATIYKIANSPYGRNYNFVTFNYTTALDELVRRTNMYLAKEQTYSFHHPIHIHGNLNRDVVLGIDNEEQLKTTKFSLTKKGKRAFIKPFFNDCFDKNRVNSAKKVIEESDLICAFGLSFGDSDKTWTDAIKNWLVGDSSHHLVYYVYDSTEYNSCNFDAIIDIEEERKEIFLNRIGVVEEDFDTIFEQVHIPIEKSIFKFNTIDHTVSSKPTKDRPLEVAL